MTGRPWQIVAAVVGAVIGIVAVRYLGLNAVIPALSMAACWWAFTRLGVHRRLVLPLAFTGGHGVWFLIGVVMTLAIGGGVHAVIEVGVETLVVAAIVAWVYASRSSPSLLVLIAYEAVSIVINVVTFTEVGGALAGRHRRPRRPAPRGDRGCGRCVGASRRVCAGVRP
jgi:hypothetical protein